MKKLIITTMVLFVLASCTTFSKIASIPPKEAKKNIDIICDTALSGAQGSIVDFYSGGYQGWYLGDWKSKLTVQELQDYEGFMKFCDKPVETRTMTEYGYWEATKYRTLAKIIPFKSAIEAVEKMAK